VSIIVRARPRDTAGTLNEVINLARSTRSAKLETRAVRLKLPVAKKPLFIKVAPRVGLGYRRNRTDGTWVARVAEGTGGNWTKGHRSG